MKVLTKSAAPLLEGVVGDAKLGVHSLCDITEADTLVQTHPCFDTPFLNIGRDMVGQGREIAEPIPVEGAIFHVNPLLGHTSVHRTELVKDVWKTVDRPMHLLRVRRSVVARVVCRNTVLSGDTSLNPVRSKLILGKGPKLTPSRR